jgi:hypothetical protein
MGPLQGEVFTIVMFIGRVHTDDTHYELPYPMHVFSLGTFLVDASVQKDRHNLTNYQQNLRYVCTRREPETTYDEYADNLILPIKEEDGV